MSSERQEADRRTVANATARTDGRRQQGDRARWTKNFLDMPLAGLLDFSGLGKAL